MGNLGDQCDPPGTAAAPRNIQNIKVKTAARASITQNKHRNAKQGSVNMSTHNVVPEKAAQLETASRKSMN